MGECKAEVKRLETALRDAGVKVIVIGELPGGDLLKAVTEGMEEADLFIIMGTETYGKGTSGIIDTYQEMQYIKSSKKPFFLFNMNPELSLMRFQEGAANVVFNLNTISWERWEVGAPMPAKAVEKILQKFAEAGAGEGACGKEYSGSAKIPPKVVAHGGAANTPATQSPAQPRLVEDVSAEENALREEMLALLEGYAFANGKAHFKAGNLQEASEMFRQTARDKDASPSNVAKAKKLLSCTLFKMDLGYLRNREFDSATTCFEDAFQLKAMDKRIHKLCLLRACSLYEAGKQHREDGDWGEAKRCFGAAKKTKTLPTMLKQKNDAYLEECDDKCDDIDVIELDDCTTIKIEGNAAFELYKQAKRAMALGDSNQAGLLFKAAKQRDDMPKELKKRTQQYIKELRKHKGKEATACVFSDNCTHIYTWCGDRHSSSDSQHVRCDVWHCHFNTVYGTHLAQSGNANGAPKAIPAELEGTKFAGAPAQVGYWESLGSPESRNPGSEARQGLRHRQIPVRERRR
jgi:tetratricopeptide (TPR) repeat protein